MDTDTSGFDGNLDMNANNNMHLYSNDIAMGQSMGDAGEGAGGCEKCCDFICSCACDGCDECAIF